MDFGVRGLRGRRSSFCAFKLKVEGQAEIQSEDPLSCVISIVIFLYDAHTHSYKQTNHTIYGAKTKEANLSILSGVSNEETWLAGIV